MDQEAHLEEDQILVLTAMRQVIWLRSALLRTELIVEDREEKKVVMEERMEIIIEKSLTLHSLSPRLKAGELEETVQ